MKASWERRAEAFVAKATEILRDRGLPTTWEELQQRDTPIESRLVLCAELVIADAHYLALECARGRMKQALERQYNLLASGEDMEILDGVPEYDDQLPFTDHLIRDLGGGVRGREHSSAGGRKTAENTYPEMVRNRKKALDLREQGLTWKQVAVRLGVSDRQLRRIRKE